MNGGDSHGYGCVLVKAGPNGFVRFYKNGEAFGRTFSGPSKSTVVVVVQMFHDGVSLELFTICSGTSDISGTMCQ